MPMSTTHALVPLAATLAFSRRAVPWRVVIVAAFAAAAPDLDAASSHLWRLSPNSIYLHRGAAHSLFVAFAAGLLAAGFHKRLRMRPLTAGIVIAASMASHGILDMMTDTGRPVAYLWPLTSARLFADWRPIHSSGVHRAHFLTQVLVRFQSELWQLIIPMFAIAVAIRLCRQTVAKMYSQH